MSSKAILVNGYLASRPYDRRLKRQVAIYEHRRIWEEHFGPIPPGYDVHHEDGNKTNNCIENLRCMPHGMHKTLHNPKKRAGCCAVCGKRAVLRHCRIEGVELCRSCYGIWQRTRELRRATSITSYARRNEVCAECNERIAQRACLCGRCYSRNWWRVHKGKK